ncbi:hypothetical protein EV645_6577 [Kribbella rubisoli]|uniref:Uncharacterized protein n=1 Tax=Kribbella rubisoli TaxID=3075929 RepID=A0A4Q7WNT7_9ACTN|nr:hypothetical protein EV645_6577 [Kribbella rubisoli]
MRGLACELGVGEEAAHPPVIDTPPPRQGRPGSQVAMRVQRVHTKGVSASSRGCCPALTSRCSGPMTASLRRWSTAGARRCSLVGWRWTRSRPGREWPSGSSWSAGATPWSWSPVDIEDLPRRAAVARAAAAESYPPRVQSSQSGRRPGPGRSCSTVPVGVTTGQSHASVASATPRQLQVAGGAGWLGEPERMPRAIGPWVGGLLTYLIRMSEMARAITRRWTSEVPRRRCRSVLPMSPTDADRRN